jgi:hypothetical protein
VGRALPFIPASACPRLPALDDDTGHHKIGAVRPRCRAANAAGQRSGWMGDKTASDDDADSDFDDDFVDDAEPVDDVEVEDLPRLDPAQRAARALKVRRSIEDRQERKRLEAELDYLEDLDGDE